MPSNRPILSVILPAYNAEKYITEAIISILNQSFNDFELLIADDGSTDNTKQIIESFSDNRIKTIHNSKNIGKNETVNRLFHSSKGVYITIHDADDISVKDRFEKQISFFCKNPKYSLCGTFFKTIDSRGKFIKEVELEHNYHTIKKNIIAKSQFHGPTVMFKREIVDQVGGLFRYFKWGEDIDFTLRVVEKFQATNLREFLYLYRIHDKSLTKDISFLNPDRLVNLKLRNFLAEQRKLRGYDCLMVSNFQEIESEKKRLIEELNLNPDEEYWNFSQYLWSNNLKDSARKAALKALKINFSIRNIKNLIYFYIN
jgi:glycosyltransferase involved in cell wall biosynthesis